MIIIVRINYQLKCHRKLHFYHFLFFISLIWFEFQRKKENINVCKAIAVSKDSNHIQNECKIPLLTKMEKNGVKPHRRHNNNTTAMTHRKTHCDVSDDTSMCVFHTCECGMRSYEMQHTDIFVCCTRKYLDLGESLPWHLPLNSHTNHHFAHYRCFARIHITTDFFFRVNLHKIA